MSYSNLEDKVISFTTGMEPVIMSKQKRKGLIIEDSEDSSPPMIIRPELRGSSFEKSNQVKEIPIDNPIYGKGKDGVGWNIKEYNDLWDRLPIKLKTAIRPYNEWMKKFMHSCVNLKQQGKPCEIVAPDELILPPRVLENGEYDFGVEYYNQLFNKLPETLQESYLTMYSNKDGVKDYKQLIDVLNRLVGDETGFTNTIGVF